MKEILRTLLALLLIGLAGYAPAKPQAARTPELEADHTAPGITTSEASSLSSETRRLSLEQIGGQTTFSLRSTEGSTAMTFGGRNDELVTGATLTLRYTYSPSLIPAQSHIKVLINDEMVGVAPITKENAGQVRGAQDRHRPARDCRLQPPQAAVGCTLCAGVRGPAEQRPVDRYQRFKRAGTHRATARVEE